jgi:type II secretory pathway pseudopilin PulG
MKTRGCRSGGNLRSWPQETSGVPIRECRRLGGCNDPGSAMRRVTASGSAFTLLELLVVIGLIAALAGALGLKLRAPSGAVALQAGQGALAGLCGAARARAALGGVNARLVVSADPTDADGALRWWQVVEEDAAHAGRWLSAGDGFCLPRGVYTVPPPGSDVPGDAAWPAARRSTALAAAQAMTINGAPARLFFYVAFTPRGTTGGGNLVLAAGRPGPGAAGFPCSLENSDDVRGVLLRSSGAVTLLNDAGAFVP